MWVGVAQRHCHPSLSRASSDEELTAILGGTYYYEKQNDDDAQTDPPRLTTIPTSSSVIEVQPAKNNLAGIDPNHDSMVQPFTEEQERYIVETYKEMVLQKWDAMLQSCLQQSCPREPGSMTRTPSQEEPGSIFSLEEMLIHSSSVSSQRRCQMTHWVAQSGWWRVSPQCLPQPPPPSPPSPPSLPHHRQSQRCHCCLSDHCQ